MIVLNGGYYRLTIFRYLHCVLIFSMNMNVKMMIMLNKNMFCILSISIKNKPYIQNKKCLNFSLRVRLPQGGGSLFHSGKVTRGSIYHGGQFSM